MPSLRPYQQAGVDWLSCRRAALLADEPRVGKTPQAICALNELQARRPLVVCPASVVPNWREEFDKWGDPEIRPTVLSYDQLRVRSSDRQRYDVAIFDEAHYLKNPIAKRTAAAMNAKADRFWFLTGTPAPNHAGELWTVAYKCGATSLTYEAWCRRYCTFKMVRFRGARGFQTTRETISGTNMARAEELKALMATYSLRRTQSEVELPALDVQTLVVETGLADGMFAALEALADGPVEDPSVAAARRELAGAKVTPVCEILADELDNRAYDKVVVFAIHRDVVADLRTKLRAYNPAVLTGETRPGDRQRAIERFQTDPTCRVFIGNVEAAGTGIRLDAANQVVMLEADWRPGVNQQAMMRPLTLANPVAVRFVTSTNQLDRLITTKLSRKSQQLAELFA